jgi:deazaflavin-dependent oxidoreductase (nitroreductase family)
MDWGPLNAEVVVEFRSNRGKVARFGDLPVVILHTVGARSGQLREIPLIVIFDSDEMLIFGTAAGAAQHPDWYFNLRAHPRITVEYGEERFAADVQALSEAETHQKVQEQAGAVKQFADYVASAAPRAIPVFRITRL